MAVEWFEIAKANDFWIRRRFTAFRKLTRCLPIRDFKVGEIGCGHGLVQEQFERHYGVKVDGFDLNEAALRKSVAVNHSRFCYSIFDRKPDFASSYDMLVLFDVLEHVERDDLLLDAVLFHLKPGGYLAINVPALMISFSQYDEVMGHQRRYTLKQLNVVCEKVGISNTGGDLLGSSLCAAAAAAPAIGDWPNGRACRHSPGLPTFGSPGQWLAERLWGSGTRPHRLFWTSAMGLYRKQPIA